MNQTLMQRMYPMNRTAPAAAHHKKDL